MQNVVYVELSIVYFYYRAPPMPVTDRHESPRTNGRFRLQVSVVLATVKRDLHETRLHQRDKQLLATVRTHVSFTCVEAVKKTRLFLQYVATIRRPKQKYQFSRHELHL